MCSSHRSLLLYVAMLPATASGPTAGAGVVEYDTREAWYLAVDQVTTIDFTDQLDGTPIDEQYAPLGLHVSGSAFIYESSVFLQDGFGLFCPDGVEFQFMTPQRWIAVHHTGPLMMSMYLGDEVVYTSALFVPLEQGAFAGLVSDESFDRVTLYAPVPFNPNLFLDDLHLGGAVPGAGGALLLLLGVPFRARRR